MKQKLIIEIEKELLDERCKTVLKYFFPNYENLMSARQFNNAMEALRSIALGTPNGKI
jgi:hypothetical protein